MNEIAQSVRLHAQLLSDQQLRRLEGRLSQLGVEDRLAVDELAHAVAVRVAESLLDEAQRDPWVARALASVYS